MPDEHFKKEQQHRETGGDEDRDGFAEPSKRIVGSERFLCSSEVTAWNVGWHPQEGTVSRNIFEVVQ